MRRTTRVGIILLVPALALILLILVFPVIQTLLLSLEQKTTTIFGPFNFAGLRNYTKLFATPRFLKSVWNTVLFAGATVPLELALGVGMALLLNKALPGRWVVRMAVLFPWALPTALNALMWRWMFNSEFGLFNAALTGAGITQGNINWLGAIPLGMISMMTVAVWKTSSFIALLILAGLQSIPPEVIEAGKVDGTTRWSEFRYITWPLIVPTAMVALLLRTMDALRTFELPFNLTDGGPLNSTETISLYAYRLIFQYVDFNLGSAALVIQFLVIMLISVFYILGLRGSRHG